MKNILLLLFIMTVSLAVGSVAEAQDKGWRKEFHDGSYTLFIENDAAWSVESWDAEDCRKVRPIFKNATSVVVEEGVTRLDGSSLCATGYMLDLSQAKGLKLIEFQGAHEVSLTSSVELPEVERINACGFIRVQGDSVALPKVKYIGDGWNSGAFYKAKLSYISLPKVRYIGCSTFEFAQINSILLSDCLQHIGDDAFKGCSISSILLSDSLQHIGDYAFQYCSISSILLPDSMKHIGDGAFYGSAVSSIKIPAGLEYLGDRAFEACRNLRSVELPEGMEEIPSGLFAGCDSLCAETGKLVLPPNVKKIGHCAFQACLGIKYVVLPASLDTVGESVFADHYVSSAGYHYSRDYIRVDCYALDPPYGYHFRQDGYLKTWKGDLYVPAESVEKYKNSPWAEDFNIYALDPKDNPYTAIRDVDGNKLKVSVRGGVVSVEGVDEFDVYDMSGRKMPAGRPLPAGVYVVTTGTGSERVVVK